ncbi:MAG: GEVED domain-containing protein [Candidatus Bathyarchaeia archaeon]
MSLPNPTFKVGLGSKLNKLKYFTLLVLAIIVASSLTNLALAHDEITLTTEHVHTSTHTFRFVSVTYNSDGTSTWCYEVISSGDPKLSHWVLEICPTAVIKSATVKYEDMRQRDDGDPTTGVKGIKFTSTGQVCFTLDKWYAKVSNAFVVGIFAGGAKNVSSDHSLLITGPSCQVTTTLKKTFELNVIGCEPSGVEYYAVLDSVEAQMTYDSGKYRYIFTSVAPGSHTWSIMARYNSKAETIAGPQTENIQIDKTNTVTYAWPCLKKTFELNVTGCEPSGVEYWATLGSESKKMAEIDSIYKAEFTVMEGTYAWNVKAKYDSKEETIGSGEETINEDKLNKLKKDWPCLKFDFGDAPNSPYPTLLANNGARHIIGSIWMGATVDAEPDGQPHPIALGDDLNPPGGPDDEDGVILLGPWPSASPHMPYIPGQDGAVKITVTEATPGIITSVHPAYLHGWIDWNGDGDWDDDGEYIFCNFKVTAPGEYIIVFHVPSITKPGITYARFRLVDDPNLNSPAGEAANGEVEDYIADPMTETPNSTPTPRPVGGYVLPTDKSAVLSPYLVLAGLVGVGYTILAFKRRCKA